MSQGRWRALAALTVMGLLLGATSILFTVAYVRASDRQFCQVITGFTATPVARPANPAANPSRETSWEWYERFARLGRSLGCS